MGSKNREQSVILEWPHSNYTSISDWKTNVNRSSALCTHLQNPENLVTIGQVHSEVISLQWDG